MDDTNNCNENKMFKIQQQLTGTQPFYQTITVEQLTDYKATGEANETIKINVTSGIFNRFKVVKNVIGIVSFRGLLDQI